MGEGINMEDIGKNMGQLLANSSVGVASELVPYPFRKGQDRLLGNETTRKAWQEREMFWHFPKKWTTSQLNVYLNAFSYYYSMILNWPVWSVNARNALRHNWRFGPQFSARHQNLMLDPAAQFPSGTISTQTWRVGKSTIWWFFHYIINIINSSISANKASLPCTRHVWGHKKIGVSGMNVQNLSSPKLMWKPRASP